MFFRNDSVDSARTGSGTPVPSLAGARRFLTATTMAGLLAGFLSPWAGAAAEECPMHPSRPGKAAPGDKAGENPGTGETAVRDGGEEARSYPRSLVSVDLPNVVLEGSDGAGVSLSAALGGDKPVMLNFIFTTCGTICPLMSAGFSRVREGLGPDRERLRMVSISIDPEHDTPAVLREYAKRFDAGSDWVFLTGKVADIIAVQQAFGAYRGNKMNHQPYTFLRSSPGSSWVRIGEIVSADDLEREARAMFGAR